MSNVQCSQSSICSTKDGKELERLCNHSSGVGAGPSCQVTALTVEGWNAIP